MSCDFLRLNWRGHFVIAGQRFLAMFNGEDGAGEVGSRPRDAQAEMPDEVSPSEASCDEDEADELGASATGSGQASAPAIKVAPPRPQIDDRPRYAAERRAFMSSKVKASSSVASPSAVLKPRKSAAAPRDEEAHVSKAEFLQMQREVFDLGRLAMLLQ